MTIQEKIGFGFLVYYCFTARRQIVLDSLGLQLEKP